MKGLSLPEEDDILIELHTGDKLSFSKLFNRYYAPLCSYAATFLKYSEVAEEVVQESFIKIWENRVNIRIEMSMRAYLYRTVHNNCISYIRGEIVNRKQSSEIREEILKHATIVTNELSDETLDMIICDELEIFLQKVIDNLPGQCNKIFNLSRHGRLSNKEIADIMGISVNTVKTQLSRAFCKLRAAYDYFKKI